jgi:hypothetical protein
MKPLMVAFVLLASGLSFAADNKVEEKKDFSVICAISKAAKALSNDKYVTDKTEQVFLISNMIEKSIKTEEVKNVLRAVAASNPSQKLKLMQQAAGDVGLKNWNCGTLNFLF